MRPFDEPEVAAASAVDSARMRAFNKRLSSIRIASEHAFGLLKGRFPSLKEMGKHENIQDMYKAIEAMMVLHNICIDWSDRPEDIWDYDPTDVWPDDGEEGMDVDIGCEVIGGDAQVPGHETDAWLKEMGRQKRMNMLNELFPV